MSLLIPMTCHTYVSCYVYVDVHLRIYVVMVG